MLLVERFGLLVRADSARTIDGGKVKNASITKTNGRSRRSRNLKIPELTTTLHI